MIVTHQGEALKRKFWTTSTTIILISTLLLLALSLLTVSRIEQVYRTTTSESIEHLKRQFLHDTVQNQIKRIDTMRMFASQRYTDELNRKLSLLDNAYSTGDGFLGRARSYLSNKANVAWTAVLWEKETGKVILDTHSLVGEGEVPIEVVGKIVADYSIHTFRSYAPYTLFLGIPQKAVEDEVKAFIAEEIHNSTYSENSYIWVNEVVNWEGGDDYAIRRIHPNLRDTIGTLLSTSMTDIKGNTPYKTELEGVKEHGELFFTYYFQKKDSEEISEKLTYAKLYKDYNWIVAMGIHLDDLSAYVDNTNNQSSFILRQITPLLIFLVLGLFVFNSVLLMIIEKRKSKKDNQALQIEANQDTLTGVGNRRYGESVLKDLFFQFKRDQKPVLLAIFDIDFFKHINDTYGHDIGDRTLVQLCRSLEDVVCTKDSLFRLGGDEFLIICPDIEGKALEQISTTLLETARAVDVSSEGASFSLTISIGITTFHESDENEQQALKRADKALYRAKQSGRDRCEVDW